jgi:hypothetical protein
VAQVLARRARALVPGWARRMPVSAVRPARAGAYRVCSVLAVLTLPVAGQAHPVFLAFSAVLLHSATRV